MVRVWICLAVIYACSCLAQNSGAYREYYLNIAGSTVADLTNNPAFPGNASGESILPSFELPENFGDFYGTRVRALLKPTVSGTYYFYFACDDGGELWLGTDATAGSKRLIASVTGWTGPRAYYKMTSQKSAGINLQAGQSYYIEALQKENSGGDHMAVAWQPPGSPAVANGDPPIPGTYLQPYGLGAPVFTMQPTSQSAVENSSASFTVELERSLGATFQWSRNGLPISGATNKTFVLTPVTMGDHNAVFRCLASNSSGSSNSQPATLTVLADTTPPTIVRAGSLADPSFVNVVFSEPVDPVTAKALSSYSIDERITIFSADLLADGTTVVLKTSPLSAGTSYQLTCRNVRDRALVPNTMATATRTLVTTFVPVDVGFVNGLTEPAGPSSRASGLTITEIMYHPTNRADARNLEFVEIYNSNPWQEDLSGYRLVGDVGYTFPQGTTIPPLGYRVVAPVPADVQAVYGVFVVLGPLTNDVAGNTTDVLKNGGGTVRLVDELGSVLVEVDYDDEDGWPASPDGAGHSLVLARPSYGEKDPFAWAASDTVGGSPQRFDSLLANPYRTILINEILAHTDDPQVDYIELYNYGAAPVDISGCILTDDITTNRFVFPPGTSLPARGLIAVEQAQLGFALSAEGESIYFVSPTGQRVLEALKFGPQENGVPFGRYPDGAPAFSRLQTPTPNLANSPLRVNSVVISELMYHPVSEDSDEEFVELHNRSINQVDVSGWRLRGGISFNIPGGTTLPAGGFLVVAKNRVKLLATHPSLSGALTLGDFSGKLGNGGDTVQLLTPDELISTNSLNQRITNTIHIVVHEVNYGTGGRWAGLADGGGSSLELRDARADARLAPNWDASDETSKSGWTTVEHTGILDLGGMANPSQLHLFLLGAGECLVDNVEVIPQGGGNLVQNWNFEGGVSGWTFQGTHQDSRWENAGYNSGGSLRVVASDRGDTGANRIRVGLTTTPGIGSTVTLRARVKWLSGHPEILLRLYGNWLEASGNTITTGNLGTPGAPNSRAAANIGPAITRVTHTPVLPSAGQQPTVVAQVHDPDSLAALNLYFRVDPSTAYTVIPMTYRGAGLYSATLPGQQTGTMGAFYIEAVDNGIPRASSRFPADAPMRECLVRWGETTPTGNFATYRLWVSQTNVNRWINREKNSNHPLDCTFVLGNHRVMYNAATLYSGSPWHSPGFTSPVGNLCDYEVNFAKDDVLLGTEDFTLCTVGNLDNDATYQAEQLAFWIGRKIGAPYLYRRYIRVMVNGVQRTHVYEDAQQPSREIVQQWWPDDDSGDLHKIEDWFEFSDSGDQRLGNVDATLQDFTTSGGVKKTARYRWTWRPRAVRESASNFTNLFTLVDVMNATQPEPYRSGVNHLLDVDNVTRILAMERVVGNWDSYGYDRGKNMYAYKPTEGKWGMLPWDIDFVMSSGGRAADSSLFGGNDPVINSFLQFPEFQRAYWRALQDIVEGPLDPVMLGARVDQRYNALTGNGVPAAYPQGLKDYAGNRRSYVLGELAGLSSTFNITSPSSFSTNRNLVVITGNAPIEAASILVNGQPVQVQWSSVSEWRLNYALAPGANHLTFSGLNNRGEPVAGVSGQVNITYTGIVERPEDRLVINEIMYNPLVPDASFIELHNTSAINAFDLSGWRIEGVDCDIPFGTIVEPGAYLVFVQNPAVFSSTYGTSIRIAGVFSGSFDKGGETLKLVRPTSQPGLFEVVNQVTYDDDAPWNLNADGLGSSLQLIDPLQDNNRVCNWNAVSNAPPMPATTLVNFTDAWKYEQTANLDGQDWTSPSYPDGSWPSGPALLYVENAGLPVAKNTLLSLGRITYYFRKQFVYSGPPGPVPVQLSTVVDDGAIFYVNGAEVYRTRVPDAGYNVLATNNVNNAIIEGPFSFWVNLVTGTNVMAVEVHQVTADSTDIVFGCQLVTDPVGGMLGATPGVVNSVRATLPKFPPVWLNELLPNNVAGATDRFGEKDPWVEVYHAGNSNLSASAFYLSDSYTNLTRWKFPAGLSFTNKQFLTVWLDGEPAESLVSEPHASFRIPSAAGSLALTWSNNGVVRVLDYLNFNVPTAGRSYGSYPDANVSNRRLFTITTPGATNNPADAPVTIYINEWMADNAATLADPADSQYEDWFELYNPGDSDVNLGGFYLTDTLTNKTKWQIPPNVIVPARGHLLVWADGEPDQYTGSGSLHADFALGKGGEEVALYAPEGTLVDAVVFGAQTTDVSEGRFPDGSGEIFSFTTASPGLSNIRETGNTAPMLSAIGNRVVDEGSLVTFTAEALDADVPAQTLTFSLATGAPAGANVHPSTGVFSWIPAEQQGPGTYAITLVVQDNGAPPLSASRTFNVQVNESNNPPVLAAITSPAIDEGMPWTLTLVASDSDTPAQSLTFSAEGQVPAGFSVNPASGVVSWTPAEAQGPGSYSITLRVSDDGEPAASSTQPVTIQVNEVNLAPVLELIPNYTNHANAGLVFDVSASDADLPSNVLTFALIGTIPPGASIDSASGRFTWVAGNAGTNTFTVEVSDADSKDSRTFTVVSLSPLNISQAELFNGALRFTWDSIPGTSYQVQSAPAPEGPWQDEGLSVSASEWTTSVEKAVSDSQRFFRIKTGD